jgi:fatty acid desaturase
MTNDELDIVARSLVSDLHEPRPIIFWADAIGTAVAGWSSFALGLAARPLSAGKFAALSIAVIALYRGVCFIHELTHIRRRALPGFETAWNLLFGVPLLLPSFTYMGVHQSHHNLSTYGTKDDPEYLPLASSKRLMVVFALQSTFLVPVLLAVRFLVLAPLGLAWPRFHRWLEAHATSFAMNPEYRRDVSDEMRTKIRRWELAVLAAWAVPFAAAYNGFVPVRFFVIWYAVLAAISFLNTARVLGAHEYESDGSPRSRHGQLSDSIDTPGGPWSEIWAPVGLRYHALHHYFPGIPYHNLPAAYRRLVAALPDDSLYRESSSPSLYRSLSVLYRKGR